MIDVLIEIKNPWSQDRFKNLGSVSGRLTKNKSWELEHTFYDGMIFDIELRLTTKKDHAGLEISLGVLGYGIHFILCDNRHWDKDLNTWKDND